MCKLNTIKNELHSFSLNFSQIIKLHRKPENAWISFLGAKSFALPPKAFLLIKCHFWSLWTFAVFEFAGESLQLHTSPNDETSRANNSKMQTEIIDCTHNLISRRTWKEAITFKLEARKLLGWHKHLKSILSCSQPAERAYSVFPGMSSWYFIWFCLWIILHICVL